MSSANLPRLRHAIIGVGASVLAMHRPALALEAVDLVAAHGRSTPRNRQTANDLGCAFYDDYQTMLAEVRPDVTVILTPHPYHAAQTIAALQSGSHVLVEKPIAVHVAEADAMIAAADAAQRLLAVNFQQRFRPEIRAAYQLLRQGKLGEIQHVDVTMVWPRTAVYYNTSIWRGTWAGEGGGVLMNQAPHNLDLLCHLVGMPSRVVAWTRNLMHAIETEDTVQAMLEWPNGALGSLHNSTAEAGLPPRLEIIGTKGVLHIHEEKLEMTQLETDLREFVVQADHPFAAPGRVAVSPPLASGIGDHVAVYSNLHNAILHGEPLIADGADSRMSLELANAMIYSSYTGTAVTLPLNREKYTQLLQELIQSSSIRS